MTKADQAKQEQGWQEKSFIPCCANCRHYRERVRNGRVHKTCGLGHFPTTPYATCDRHISR